MAVAVAGPMTVTHGDPTLRAQPILVPMRWGYLRRDGGRGRTTRWHLVPANALRDRTLCGVRPRPFALIREWRPGLPTTRPPVCLRCHRQALVLIASRPIGIAAWAGR